MIISRIIGGLGNQMFQYAAGRALSLERGQPFRLDVAGFTDYGLHHGFELQRVFNCSAEIGTEAEVRTILGWQFASVIRRAVSRPALTFFRRDGFVIEPHFDYWPGINDVPKDCYLSGYWQSEKYFKNVAEVIRNEFTFKFPLASQNAEVAHKISKVSAVSLHVRRGDYAKNSKTTAMHGLCSLDYYWDAIQYISVHVEQPYFFIFSDDIAWVKSNLKIDFPCQYVDHNYGSQSYSDMHLMSLCQYHIIANSSFSWWGAWLNQNKNKIVIAPLKWFATKQQSTQDLIPTSWVKL
jgi:hypothetical protein